MGVQWWFRCGRHAEAWRRLPRRSPAWAAANRCVCTAMCNAAAAAADACPARPAPPRLQLAPLRRWPWRPAPWLACCAPWCTARCALAVLGRLRLPFNEWSLLLLGHSLLPGACSHLLCLLHITYFGWHRGAAAMPMLGLLCSPLLPPDLLIRASLVWSTFLQTVKYNMKKRAGRGFTLEELKVGGQGQNQTKLN